MSQRFLRLLALCALLFAPLARAGAIDELQRFLDNTHAARGTFTQTVSAQSGRKPQESSGTFAFQRPGRFRWTYEKPYPQLLVGDGSRLWSFDPDLKQATVKTVGDALGSTPAAILAGDNALQRNFQLSDQGQRDGLNWVAAEPRKADSSFVVIRLGLQGDQLKQMELLDHFGQTTVLRFTKLDANPSLDAGLFHFVPPAGVDVIGEQGSPR